MAVRRLGTVLTLMGLAVMAAMMGPGTSGRAQDLPATVQIYEGSTHVGYLGPTLPVEKALANAAPYISAIWYFDRFDANSPWKLWGAGLPGPLQGFSELTFGEAYFTVSSLSFELV
jgi:hypothetical protein